MNDPAAFERLRAIGLTPADLEHLNQMPALLAEPALLRVTEVQREGLTLHDGAQPHAARLLPALRKALAAHSDAIAVGDWVLAERDPFGHWWAHQRLPPRNQLARRLHDGRDKLTRVVIVSNVDTALLVMGLDHDFNLRRLDRYASLARMAGVAVVVVLTKADQCADPAARAAEVQAALPHAAGVVAVNALGAAVGAVLAPWLLAGQTLVLLGSSGAGKSTLTNALAAPQARLQAVLQASQRTMPPDLPPGLPSALAPALPPAAAAAQRTGALRDGDSRGRHTTTARSLHRTPQGACIIDTPGLRTLRLDGDAQALGAVFDDIAQLALQCRFRDCSHQAEPGCAVRDTVGNERLRSWHKLLREARRDTASVLERQAQMQHLKARGRAAHADARRDGKRGPAPAQPEVRTGVATDPITDVIKDVNTDGPADPDR